MGLFFFFFFFFFYKVLRVKYKFIEFFVFDYDSLPIYFQSGIAFPLLAPDKIIIYNCFIQTLCPICHCVHNSGGTYIPPPPFKG